MKRARACALSAARRAGGSPDRCARSPMRCASAAAISCCGGRGRRRRSPASRRQTSASALLMNHRDDPAGAAIDRNVTTRLAADGTEVKVIPGESPARSPRTSNQQRPAVPGVHAVLAAAARRRHPRAPIPAPARIAGATGIAGDRAGRLAPGAGPARLGRQTCARLGTAAKPARSRTSRPSSTRG